MEHGPDWCLWSETTLVHRQRTATHITRHSLKNPYGERRVESCVVSKALYGWSCTREWRQWIEAIVLSFTEIRRQTSTTLLPREQQAKRGSAEWLLTSSSNRKRQVLLILVFVQLECKCCVCFVEPAAFFEALLGTVVQAPWS